MEYPEYPYSEVVDYTENADGTITLIVNVVFPYACDSKVYAHEVVVRVLDDDGVQYVSNRVIDSENNHEVTWYTPRLTKTECGESLLWLFPQTEDSLFTDEEKQMLQKQALLAADKVKSVYKTVYASTNKDFSSDKCKEVVAILGEAGYVGVTDNCNMENSEMIEKFYYEYMDNKEAAVTVYDVNQDGSIGSITFMYRSGKLQTYYIGIEWKDNGTPELMDTLVKNVSAINLTEKGYFIYQYETQLIHANLREYWRIKPLSDTCRELTEKYISKLSYVNYNLLVIDWDSSNVEDILMPCMFEDIYRIYSDENLRLESDRIPADIYEKIMTTYFPVTTELLRKNCGYDESDNSYQYEIIYASQYPPFGEVIDYMENTDGTITLIVDGVWADYNSDCAFTNRIVGQPFDDGTFRILSNSIEQKELDLPPIARKKG